MTSMRLFSGGRKRGFRHLGNNMIALLDELDWYLTRRFHKIDLRSSAYRDKALGKKVYVLGEKSDIPGNSANEEISLLSYRSEKGILCTPFFTTHAILKKYIDEVMRKPVDTMRVKGLDLFVMYSTNGMDLIMDPDSSYQRLFSNSQIKKTLERHALKASLQK